MHSGCFIGNGQAAQYTRERYNWSGKCFTDFADDDAAPTKVTNIYTQPEALSGNWASLGTVDGVSMLPGDTEVSNSWSVAMPRLQMIIETCIAGVVAIHLLLLHPRCTHNMIYVALHQNSVAVNLRTALCDGIDSHPAQTIETDASGTDCCCCCCLFGTPAR